MKIEKAIEIQELYVNHLPPGVREDFIDAEKLGIEALKREKERREYTVFRIPTLLPGETEE